MANRVVLSLLQRVTYKIHFKAIGKKHYVSHLKVTFDLVRASNGNVQLYEIVSAVGVSCPFTDDFMHLPPLEGRGGPPTEFRKRPRGCPSLNECRLKLWINTSLVRFRTVTGIQKTCERIKEWIRNGIIIGLDLETLYLLRLIYKS